VLLLPHQAANAMTRPLRGASSNWRVIPAMGKGAVMRLLKCGVCVCLLLSGSVRAQELEPRPSADPIEVLRQALRSPVRAVATRDTQLRAALERLQTPEELQRALQLSGWRDGDLDEEVAAVDMRQRAAAVERFEREVRSALRQDDLDGRLGAVRMI